MKRKLCAIIILNILLSNILSGIIYSIKADFEGNNTVNETNEVEENIIDENTVADDSNNEIENTIANAVNNTTIDDTIEDEVEEEENIEEVQVNNGALFSANPQTLGVSYRTHVENIGWQDWRQNGVMAGTSGMSYRLEGINIQLVGPSTGLKIKYQVHVENIGWQEWKTDGEMAGTSGMSYRLEGIRISLEGTDDYSVQYRVHVQDIGWQSWKTDGEMAGTSGRSLRLEGIEINIVPKVKKAIIQIESPIKKSRYYDETSVKVKGWKMANISNTTMKIYIDNSTTPIDSNLITYENRNDVISTIEGYGTSIQNPTPGFEFPLDISSMSEGGHTIKVVLYSQNNEVLKEATTSIIIDRGLHVLYNAHVENIGWQGYIIDGNIAGSPGGGLRMEALKIKLTNAPKGGKIVYRTFVQNKGWLSWTSNDGLSGTSGESLRIEALQIKLENMDNYTVEYRVYIQGIGWTDNWYIDGETAGTVGQSRRIEAIGIRIVSKYKRKYYGIDVSSFNGDINWALAKRDGVEFAMIRIGYRGWGQAGNFAFDIKFLENIAEAKQVGIPVGVYFVTQAITPEEAIEEADWIARILRDNNLSLDYPIALDIEAPGGKGPGDVARTDHLDKATRTYLAKLFCIAVQNNGYTPMIYTNVNWAYNYLNMSELANYDTWIAHYKNNINSKPDYNGEYAMWQHTSSGTINGILGRVDGNICYKKY